MPEPAGENVTVEETKDEIIIRMKKDYRGAPSSTGKTIRVASTLGNKQVGKTGVYIGLNAYVKPKA